MNEEYKKRYMIFLVGGIGYALIELFYRGFTHWTMMFTGGFCFLGIYIINLCLPHVHIIKKTALGMLLILFAEFTVGCIVNLWLGWNVWDYSNLPFNLFGQICLYYSLMWCTLTFPIHWYWQLNFDGFNEKFLAYFRRLS